MKQVPRISEAEWLVMKVLWQRAPRTANEVAVALAGETRWSPRTVKTLLSRLLKKKALGYRKIDRSYAYTPLVDERTCAREESRTLLRRVWGGSLGPMLAGLIEEEPLTPAQIEELRKLLEEKGSEQ
jgi:BlaI family transcriptional regulator, penicillinase repressor